MEIAVVYESVYGNTHEVADAIAEGVHEAEPEATVACLRVGDAVPDRVRSADLLIVGGPTHMHGMSSGMSRKMAVQGEAKKAAEGTETVHEIEPGAESRGLRDWFHQLPDTTKGHFAAAFDTRAEFKLAGGAAGGIAHRLHRHGYDMVGEEGFLIDQAEGPLRDGERDRARAWGAALVHQLATAGR